MLSDQWNLTGATATEFLPKEFLLIAKDFNYLAVASWNSQALLHV